MIQASEQIRQLKAVLGDFEPVKIVLSHSHADHVGGTRLWSGENTELIAHEEFEEEQRTSRSSIPTCISVIAPVSLDPRDATHPARHGLSRVDS